MRKELSLLMGVKENASPLELRRQYQRLITALMNAESESEAEQAWRYKNAREKLTEAFEKTREQLGKAEQLHGSVTGAGILLGELLTDAEVISKEQLDDALQAQSKSKPPLPLGRILVARKLISWEQLAYFLKLQDLLQLPVTHQQRLSRQLIELGILTRAEVEVASTDCETTGCSIFHAIGRRAWIKQSVLASLTGTVDKAAEEAENEAAASLAARKIQALSV
ncbi:MAG: hypothetical protein K2X27_05865 [Candidatus Obscuribacterales bacterium]|nr:hypothetical protein [Candidatus Obscuribacterales bacterium]